MEFVRPSIKRRRKYSTFIYYYKQIISMKKSVKSTAAEQGASKEGARAVYKTLLEHYYGSGWQQQKLMESISSAFPKFDSLPWESKKAVARALYEKISPSKQGAFMLKFRGAGVLTESISKTVNDAAEKERKATEAAEKESERQLNEKKAFEARLSHARRPASEGFSDDLAAKALSGKKMLVVEDREDLLKDIGERFTIFGAAVSLASDGQTAISLVSNINFDVVVLDHELIGELGTDVARKLRALYKDKNPNAIFISFSGSVEKVLRVPDSAELFNDFAEKPSSNKLMSRIVDAISLRESSG